MLQRIFFYIMVLLYFVAGINHFVKPELYLKMMPLYIPFHAFCIYFSGICEVAFALLLISIKTRKVAAWMIVIMLVIFFIIHVQMLIDNLDNDNGMFWLTIVRIPIQFLLVWWAWLYTKNPQPKS